MGTIFAILFLAIAIFACFRWWTYYISTAALLWYIQERNVPLPSKEDMKNGTSFAVRHTIEDFFQGKR